MTKDEARAYIRLLKAQHKGEQATIDLSYHPRIAAAKVIATYAPLPDEPRVILPLGKTILLPKIISSRDMELRQYISEDEMAAGSFGINEPTTEPWSDYDAIDLIIIPGVAFDERGNRLGRGKGYYDRLLPRLDSAYKIGVAYQWQRIDHLPHEPHDIPADEVICI